MIPRADAPAPMRRRGPRPLGLHLALAVNSTSSAAGSPNSNAPPAPPPDPAFVRGIAAYRRHPYVRTLTDPPAIWEEGGSRLLDYGGAGPAVLFVPSLINRAYVLDLAEERSMLRFLAEGGVRPLLLDWGWPGEVERRFTLTDYIAARLERAMTAVPEPVVLAGYCMGGLLAAAAALRQPARVRALALLATPWDFHAPDPAPGRLAAAALTMAGPLLARGTLPVDTLQSLFVAGSIDAVAARYRAFPSLDPASERARMFVALEDWLSDGVPLAAPVATECLGGWYGQNTPGTGQWQVDGQPVDPAALHIPTLIALPGQDTIVPPESAAALARLVPHATVLRPKAGHVGMVAGAHARVELWTPLLGWLRTA
jgi:polyhydroxyalkanoate synthase